MKSGVSCAWCINTLPCEKSCCPVLYEKSKYPTLSPVIRKRTGTPRNRHRRDNPSPDTEVLIRAHARVPYSNGHVRTTQPKPRGHFQSHTKHGIFRKRTRDGRRRNATKPTQRGQPESRHTKPNRKGPQALTRPGHASRSEWRPPLERR